ncbi:DinB family protein [Ensifer soli]|uniref:DinB family protein n=1 Tax=Ciceribacter sp. sgz301302 TaxID=3342379 RepID=UPI0035B9A2FD
MIEHFRMFAAYNIWANRRVYGAAAALDDRAYRQEAGAFFGSLHRTLNHLLVADRVWMRRFTGSGPQPQALDEILHEDFAGLEAARDAEDARIRDWIDGLAAEALDAPFTYSPISSPAIITQRLGAALSHMFNHQTHHRGQCHAILTGIGGPSLVLDLVYFLRAEGAEFA